MIGHGSPLILMGMHKCMPESWGGSSYSMKSSWMQCETTSHLSTHILPKKQIAYMHMHGIMHFHLERIQHMAAGQHAQF